MNKTLPSTRASFAPIRACAKTAYGGRFSVWAFHVRQCAHHAQQLAVHPLRRRGRCCYLRHPQLCTGGAAAAFVRYRRGHPAAGELLPRCGRPCGPASFTAPRAAFTAGGGRGAVRRHIPCSGTAAAAVWRFVRDRPGKRSALLFAVAFAAVFGAWCACTPPAFTPPGRPRRSLVLYFWRSAWRKPLFLFLLPPMLGVNGIWPRLPQHRRCCSSACWACSARMAAAACSAPENAVFPRASGLCNHRLTHCPARLVARNRPAGYAGSTPERTRPRQQNSEVQ